MQDTQEQNEEEKVYVCTHCGKTSKHIVVKEARTYRLVLCTSCGETDFIEKYT